MTDRRPAERPTWGDSLARGFLGLVGSALLVAWLTLDLPAAGGGLAALLGLVFAVLCAFFPAIEGSIELHGLRVHFSGPQPRRPTGASRLEQAHQSDV